MDSTNLPQQSQQFAPANLQYPSAKKKFPLWIKILIIFIALIIILSAILLLKPSKQSNNSQKNNSQEGVIENISLSDCFNNPKYFGKCLGLLESPDIEGRCISELPSQDQKDECLTLAAKTQVNSGLCEKISNKDSKIFCINSVGVMHDQLT